MYAANVHTSMVSLFFQVQWDRCDQHSHQTLSYSVIRQNLRNNVKLNNRVSLLWLSWVKAASSLLRTTKGTGRRKTIDIQWNRTVYWAHIHQTANI